MVLHFMWTPDRNFDFWRYLYINLCKSLKNSKNMDSTIAQQAVDAAQAKVDADNTAIQTAQTDLTTDEAALAQAKAALADIDFINKLEALSSDDVTTINTALSSDPDNHSGISLTLPVPPNGPAA